MSLLIAKYGAPVFRRAPTQAERLDPKVCVVDVGDEHCAERMCFDHHQLPRDHVPTCSISLVLKHLGLYEDARLLCGWLEVAEWLDVRGPQKTAEWLGVARAVIDRLSSPVEGSLLRRFSGCSELFPGEPLYEVMRFVGEDLIDHLTTGRARIDRIAERATLWRLEARGEVFEALFVPRTEPLPADPAADTEQYVRVAGLSGRVAAIVYPDRRSTGFGIARFDDHPKLDFCRVAAEPDVLFAHKSGFLCKTSATAPERLQALLCAAWG
ncbi:MAG: hypothetical protein ACOX6T_01200 [Myxococcales bacterium]